QKNSRVANVLATIGGFREEVKQTRRDSQLADPIQSRGNQKGLLVRAEVRLVEKPDQHKRNARRNAECEKSPHHQDTGCAKYGRFSLSVFHYSLTGLATRLPKICGGSGVLRGGVRVPL